MNVFCISQVSVCVSESTGTSGTAAAFVLLSETMSLAATWLKMRSKINPFLFYGEPHFGVLSVAALVSRPDWVNRDSCKH